MDDIRLPPSRSILRGSGEPHWGGPKGHGAFLRATGSGICVPRLVRKQVGIVAALLLALTACAERGLPHGSLRDQPRPLRSSPYSGGESNIVRIAITWLSIRPSKSSDSQLLSVVIVPTPRDSM